jgi:N-acetylneuraminate synthase/N,N'-diacetyllegionaminate synthase
MRTPFVIAEFASSHEGSLDAMLAGIAIAKSADADAFKTAWGSSGARIAERMHAAELAEMYERLFCWPRAWLPVLASEARSAGLEFICTVDCPEDIAVVAPHVDRFKIASWGALDYAFIRSHEYYGKPVIISTGLCVSGERLLVPKYAGISYLHCVSAYPAPMDELNLAAIDRESLEGFSDHSANPLTGALAIAAGAKILEVHFRADNTPTSNPDYAASLSPAALHSYVYLARVAALAMGDGIKKIQPSEEKNMRHRYVS